MFEKYSDHAKSVMERAKQEAQKLRHDHIGTEHILLGLIEVDHGIAAEILRSENIDLPHAKAQVKELMTYETGPADGDYEKLPRTAHAQTVIDDAVNEARQLKHTMIGTEHLLLGLLYENQGTGAKVLKNLGFKLEDIRKDVLSFIENQKIAS
jgi:ATP-dependent Clp protease ATP-binding subunit ClpC